MEKGPIKFFRRENTNQHCEVEENYVSWEIPFRGLDLLLQSNTAQRLAGMF